MVDIFIRVEKGVFFTFWVNDAPFPFIEICFITVINQPHVVGIQPVGIIEDQVEVLLIGHHHVLE